MDTLTRSTRLARDFFPRLLRPILLSEGLPFRATLLPGYAEDTAVIPLLIARELYFHIFQLRTAHSLDAPSGNQPFGHMFPRRAIHLEPDFSGTFHMLNSPSARQEEAHSSGFLLET